jgi:hypothetical protein
VIAPLVLSCATSPASVTTTTASRSSAGAPTQRGAFVVRLGTDTVTVEQYTRTGNRIEGDIVQRSPVASIAHYVLTLNDDGTAQKLEYSNRRPDGTLLPNGVRSVTVYYRPDTMVTEIMRDTLATSRVATRAAFPFINNSFALGEAWLGRLRATGADTATVPLLGLGAAQPTGWPVRIVSRDSARVWYFGAPQYITFDRDGRILSVDATTTTNKITVARAPAADVRALAMAFAAREAAGQGFGAQASPRDTARATVGSATLWIDYGRPSLRGRNVWEHGVLGDTIWRTGANAATQLSTSADLLANGMTIPAGKYTLWTHVSANGSYELIINKQTGQWGTVYDANQDLVRLPLQAADVPVSVERFTISIDGQGSEGAIRLAWGMKQLSLPFTVR